MAKGYELGKRVFDLAVAAVGLVLLGPAMAICWLLIRATSPGPGLFVQQRAGQDGRVFGLMKFRTMRADHAHDPDPSIVIGDDHAAVTGVGRFLRRFKLDELPNLFNVLAGDMSLVGPRPTVPEQIAEYDDFQRRRLEVRPGITGLAQVNGGTGLTWPERIEWDVYYVAHRSAWMDLKILAATAAAVLTRPEKRLRRFADSGLEL